MPNASTHKASVIYSQLTDSYIALSKASEVWQRDFTTAVRHITRTCAQVLAVDRVGLWLATDDLSEMKCLCLYQLATDDFEQGLILEARAFPRYFSALRNERMISAVDALTDPRTREFAKSYLKPLNIMSVLDGALHSDGKTRGVLRLEQIGQRRVWLEEELIFVGAVADLAVQYLAFNSIRDREHRFRALFEGSGDAVFVLRNRLIFECNPAALLMFRATREQLLGTSPDRLSPTTQLDGAPSAQKAFDYLNAALAGQKQVFEWIHKRADGSLFQAEVTLSSIMLEGSNSVMGTVRDVTERKIAEEELFRSQTQLAFRATHDALTELPNRDYLHQSATQMLAKALRLQRQAAILLLDLNRFKDVNDSLGHRIGDFLLQRVAKRLSLLLDEPGVELYRLGGDEFAILYSKVTGQEQLEQLARVINQTLRKPIEVEGLALELTASIGIALYPEHGDNSHALLRCADVAMYQAKTHGDDCRFYEPNMDSSSTRRLTILADLGVALRTGQLQLHYQPRIALKSGACTGCEALLRWHHPELGMVPPVDFIPLAELTEIIYPLSQWVLREALRQIRSWLDQGLEIAVAVNLSARNLIDTRSPEHIQDLLLEFQVPNHLLEIEITESSLITDPERALKVAQRFHELGLKLSIDDFGTGYSSLSYLKRLPVHTLKIDRSFVKDMLVDEADAVIVRSTIGLAHSFGLNVVAEGVEDQETLQALQNLHCDQAQGYLISRPIAADHFEQWYLNHQSNSDFKESFRKQS